MKTTHRIYFKNASNIEDLETESVDIIITSPPYPMIEMWDSLFSTFNEEINQALQNNNGRNAFNLMHEELNKIWKECARVLKPAGFACINIGDATRKIGNTFRLFTNHSKITNFFEENGFISLPCILWRKPTNSPNKFLGSGMLPPNAYVTLEHEYILLFKKGKEKRAIPPKSERRYESVYFWEERNIWFSDIWIDIRGTSQNIYENDNNKNIRERSAAYPLQLPYRLINMFSLYGDTVLDPFWGTGTTSIAAMLSARNSIGYELNSEFLELFDKQVETIKAQSNSLNEERVLNHIKFIKDCQSNGKNFKYSSTNYKFPIITKQEENILFYSIIDYKKAESEYTVNYSKFEYLNKKKFQPIEILQ